MTYKFSTQKTKILNNKFNIDELSKPSARTDSHYPIVFDMWRHPRKKHTTYHVSCRRTKKTYMSLLLMKNNVKSFACLSIACLIPAA